MSVHGADAKSEFRQFRENNSGIDRHQLRQMFRQMNSADRPERSSGAEQRLMNSVQQSAAQALNTVNNGFDRRIINQIERGRTIEIGANNRVLKMGAGLNLDLTSADRNIVLGDKLMGGNSIQITVGGETKSFAGGARVTAAEYLAVKQALGSGQTLEVAANGSASGGTVSIDGLTSDGNMRAASLVVAEGVTAAGNFAKGSAFKLTGDLTNYGTMLVVSDRKGGSLQGDDVLNASGARIAATGDLHIGAARTFVNDGIVTASGALMVTAGEAIKNTASISAQQDVTLYSPEIENSGNISSYSGNVNVYGPSTSALALNNAGGTVSALNGAINFRDSAYTGEFNTAITGGDLLSKTVNMTTGRGVMDVNVDKLTGTVAQSGYAAHLSADTDTLNLGDICLTGDPTYINAGGSINITGNITAAEALVIIARDDVISTTSALSIVAGDSTTGFPITIIAGANFTASGTNSPTLPAGAVSTTATILGNGTGSTNGGSVLFTGAGQTLSSRSTGKKGSGANVYIGAIEGADLDSGTIDISGLSISTGGRKSKDVNGGVIVVGSGSADGSITIGSIDTTGGTVQGGDILIRTAEVVSSTSGPISWNASGAVTSSNSMTTGALVTGTAADVTILGTVVSNFNITIDSGDDVLLGNSALVRSLEGNVDVEGFARIFSNNGLFQADNGAVILAAGDVGNTGNRVNVSALEVAVSADIGTAAIRTFGPIIINSSTAVGALNVESEEDDIQVEGLLTADSISLFSTGGDVTVNGSAQSGTGSMSFLSFDGDVIFNGVATAGASVTFNSQNGKVEFGTGSSVDAVGGISVFSTNGKILFGENSSFEANLSGITVVCGGATGTPAPDPKNTTLSATGTGTIEFNGAQVKGKKPNNTLTATAGTISFESLKKNKVTLGGGVSMLSQ